MGQGKNRAPGKSLSSAMAARRPILKRVTRDLWES